MVGRAFAIAKVCSNKEVKMHKTTIRTVITLLSVAIIALIAVPNLKADGLLGVESGEVTRPKSGQAVSRAGNEKKQNPSASPLVRKVKKETDALRDNVIFPEVKTLRDFLEYLGVIPKPEDKKSPAK